MTCHTWWDTKLLSKNITQNKNNNQKIPKCDAHPDHQCTRSKIPIIYACITKTAVDTDKNCKILLNFKIYIMFLIDKSVYYMTDLLKKHKTQQLDWHSRNFHIKATKLQIGLPRRPDPKLSMARNGWEIRISKISACFNPSSRFLWYLQLNTNQ